MLTIQPGTIPALTITALCLTACCVVAVSALMPDVSVWVIDGRRQDIADLGRCRHHAHANILTAAPEFLQVHVCRDIDLVSQPIFALYDGRLHDPIMTQNSMTVNTKQHKQSKIFD